MQQHSFFNWWMDILEKQSNFMWQKINGFSGVGGCWGWGWGGCWGWGVETWTSNLVTNALPFEVWTMKTRCFQILAAVFQYWLWWIFRLFIYGVNFQNYTCALAKAFYFWLMMNGCSWEIVIFCDKNVSLQGVSTQNLRKLGFMPMPFEVDSDLSLCHTE